MSCLKLECAKEQEHVEGCSAFGWDYPKKNKTLSTKKDIKWVRKDFIKNKDNLVKYPKMEESDWKTGDWEKSFDIKFNIGESLMNAIKQFISNLLQEQKQSLLEEKKGETKRVWFQKGVNDERKRIVVEIEKMKKNIIKKSGEGIDQAYGYRWAIDDILEKLK